MSDEYWRRRREAMRQPTSQETYDRALSLMTEIGEPATMPTYAERLKGESAIKKQRAADSIKLLDDAVLIRLEMPERMNANKTLWIPDNARREAHELYRGVVIATGPGQLRLSDGKRNPMDVAPGDRVQFYWAAGELDVTEIVADGEQYRIISEKSIQGCYE